MKAKVAVLMGGRSMERSVSLKSGRRVVRALEERGFEVLGLDVDESMVPVLTREKPDLVYIALHGKGGEDGTVQELLEIMGMPYTGPGPMSCMVGFNKVLSKELFMSEGIPTPAYFTVSDTTVKEMGAADLLALAWEKLGSPVAVKPVEQGSALGLSIVRDLEELPAAVLSAFGYDERVLLEEFVPGKEVAVSVIGDDEGLEVLPVVEVVPSSGLYDYESRYTPGKSDYFVPARLDDEAAAEVERVALAAHRLLKCRHLSRVDMIVDEGGVPNVLELNISPGMTETSLLPIAAEAAGMSFADLVERLVEISLP